MKRQMSPLVSVQVPDSKESREVADRLKAMVRTIRRNGNPELSIAAAEWEKTLERLMPQDEALVSKAA